MKAGKSNNKGLYIFAGIFSFLMLFALLGDLFINLDNRWSDFRLNLPYLLSPSGDYRMAFWKYINKPADPRISIAAIDEYTGKKYSFPFKRRYYARLYERLNALGAKAIGTDVMFFEPDKDNPENDAALVEGTRKAGNVVQLLEIDVATKKIGPPIKGLMEASRYLAYPNSDIGLDPDGYVRKFLLFYPSTRKERITYAALNNKKLECLKEYCGDIRIAALSMATYAIYTGKPLKVYEFQWLNDPSMENDLPVNPLYINFRYPQERLIHQGWGEDRNKAKFSTYRYISVADIIEDRLSEKEKEAIKGGIILVGSTSLGTYDHFPTPFNKMLPGVEVHANAIDNLLHNDYINNIVSTPWLLLLIMIVILAVIWVPVIVYRFSSKTISLVSVGIFIFLTGLDTILSANRYNMPLATVLISFIVPFIYVVVYKAISEGREKKWIKNTFGQYLSPKVVEVITKDPSKLSLGGEKRDMTVFFLDIAGFTTMSEKMTPEQLTKMLNNYLSGLTDVILCHDGVVDKYIGDCIMAFWNAPLDQKDHRKLACLAAVDCMGEINRLNTELTEFSIKPSARIGLNSGPMVVGNMGSKTRLSYTVMGDSVNLASRLEGANKYFHSKIMVSEYTYEEAKDFLEARRLGQIRVVGKAIPVKVYEPLSHKGKLSAEGKKLLEAYNEGLEAFYKGAYDKARKAFEAALAVAPQDGPSRFYLELAEKYSSVAPGDWDGTFNLTSK